MTVHVEQLEGEVAVTSSLSRSREVEGTPRSGVHRELAAATVRSVGDLANAVDAGPVAALVAGVSVVLSRFTGADDLVLGLHVTRPLLLRIHVDPAASLRDLAAQVRDAEREAENAVKAEKAEREAAASRPTPEHGGELPWGQSGVDPVARPRVVVTAQANGNNGNNRHPVDADITLTVTLRAGRIDLDIDHDSLLDPQTMASFLEACEHVLADVGRHRRPVETLRLVEARSPRPVLSASRPGAPTLPWDAFAAAVARAPGAVAVTDAAASLTFGELHGRAERLAAAMVTAGIGPEDVVAICLERGVAYAAALLATMRAGAAFLPVDASLPPARRRQMLEQASTRLVLVDPADGAPDPTCGLAIPTLSVHACGDPGALASAAGLDPEALAYVMFTSGTTGQPKGAMVEAAGMANHIEAKILDVGLGAGDVLAQTSRVSFDIVVWQYLAPLYVGARAVVLPDEASTDPSVLIEELRSHGVTVWQTVPAVLARCLDRLARTGSGLPSLRIGVSTGEALSPALARRWFATLGKVPLLNSYGSTECSDDVAHHLLPEPPDERERSVPVGRPIPGVELYLLDEQGCPLPPGFPGELVVGGMAVGRGYINDPVRTAEAFPGSTATRSPRDRRYRTGDRARLRPDGAVELLGRLDEQLKINGLRVEPGEIEAVLVDHPDVAAAAVKAWDGPNGSRQLCGYVTPRNGASLDRDDLRRFAGGRLPAPAVPTRWEVLDRLPLNNSGKVDRRSLPAPSGPAERPAAVEEDSSPHDPAEAALVDIWRELLEVEHVGVHDNFFELGGDSIQAMQVMSRARRAGLGLTAEQFFAAPTIAEQARIAAANPTDPTDPTDVPAPVGACVAGPQPARSLELSPDEWAAVIRTTAQEAT